MPAATTDWTLDPLEAGTVREVISLVLMGAKQECEVQVIESTRKLIRRSMLGKWSLKKKKRFNFITLISEKRLMIVWSSESYLLPYGL